MPGSDSKPNGAHENQESKLTEAPYITPKEFKTSYKGNCFCGAVVFELQGNPKSNVFCHCRSCQRLHGAPSTLSSIYDKNNVCFSSGVEDLVFFSPQHKKEGYVLPCKLTCRKCHSPIGNEGTNMMLILPALIDFPNPDHPDHPDNTGNDGDEKDGKDGGGRLPEAFKPTFHQYYETKIRHIQDDLPKFKYEKNNTPLNRAAEEYKKKSEAEKQAKQESQDLKESPSDSPNDQQRGTKKRKTEK